MTAPDRCSLPAARTRPDDEALVAELYREYHRPLHAFVLRLTGGDHHRAEDVVQETVVRAWRNAEGLDPQTESLMPWLATVARRVIIDQHRRRQARPNEVGDAGLAAVATSDETDQVLHSVMVAEALGELSPQHREILSETILQDRTVNQAAQALGIPVGTAKSRVYYALRALRVVFEERGITG
jgi:RNA polymerase sigma-70 factor (ECF subfamily)